MTPIHWIFSAILFAAFMFQAVVFHKDSSNADTARLAGSQFLKVLDGAKNYVADNSAALEAIATDISAAIVTGDDIKNAGYLSTNWKNRNVWGQTYRLYVVEPSAGVLESYLVTVGGDGIKENRELAKMIPLAAKVAGSEAGYVPESDKIPNQSKDILLGTGDWEFDVRAINNFESPGAGHLAGHFMGSSSSAADASDFLHRRAVPGSPELNEMQTDLGLGDHSINEASDVQISSTAVGNMNCGTANDELRVYANAEGLYICRDGSLRFIPDSGNSAILKRKHVAVHGELIPKVTCPSGTIDAEQVHISPMFVSEDGNTTAMGGFQGSVIDMGTDWMLNIRVSTQDGESNPDAQWAAYNVTQICD